MSILASLAKAYDRLSLAGDMPLPGYSAQNIHGCIVLSQDGTFHGPPAIWDPDERGRLTTRSMNVPYFGGRSGKKPPPYFLWDNTAYVLGVTGKQRLRASVTTSESDCAGRHVVI
jgi:CRISPR-associated protein Csd1